MGGGGGYNVLGISFFFCVKLNEFRCEKTGLRGF